MTAEIEYWLSEKIRVYDPAHKKVAEHERSYSNSSWTFDINHYINTLMKKPGALKGSIALRQMPEKMRELFRVHFEDNGKDFPQMKYLEELQREELPLEGQMLLPEVETLEFIKEGRSIVMYGNPGTGKTHIAIALGIKACLEGYSVFFTSVPRLLTHIREAKTSTRKAQRCSSIISH